MDSDSEGEKKREMVVVDTKVRGGGVPTRNMVSLVSLGVGLGTLEPKVKELDLDLTYGQNDFSTDYVHQRGACCMGQC